MSPQATAPVAIADQNPAPAGELEQSRRIQVVNRIGEIQEYLQVEAIRQAPFRNELAQLQGDVVSWYGELAADAPAAFETENFIAKITPREVQHKIFDRLRCYKLLRMKVEDFVNACTITQSLINRRIPKDKRHLFQTEQRSGDRSVSVLRKAPTQ